MKDRARGSLYVYYTNMNGFILQEDGVGIQERWKFLDGLKG